MLSSSDDRLASCWAIQDCYQCIQHNCGWCASSSTCIPASSLLQPIWKKNICPLWHERWELRTKALGCGCSTTTILSIIVTVFATIVALGLLYGIVRLIIQLNRAFGTGTWSGLEMEITDDGSRTEKQWKRKSALGSWLSSFFQPSAQDPNLSEQERVTERTRLLGTREPKTMRAWGFTFQSRGIDDQ